MEYVKSGKTNCIESKVLREDIIESCFAEAYQLLCKNNKDVIKRFLERIENLLSDDKIKNAIRKLQEQKIQMETTRKRLTNFQNLQRKMKERQRRLSQEKISHR